MNRHQHLYLMLPLCMILVSGFKSGSPVKNKNINVQSKVVHVPDQASPGESVKDFREEVEENILPYWIMKTKDPVNGGFYGAISNKGKVNEQADRSMVLNSRILWTFSKAYQVFREEKYLLTARRAYRYLTEHFWDDEHGGFYWSVDYQGKTVDPSKQIYAEAFGIYSMAEYFKATGDKESLEKAKKTYRLMEKHSHDDKNGGYFEAFERDWTPSGDIRIGGKEMKTLKSMNTHLHVLEAYTNLYGVWRTDELEKRIREMTGIFLEHIINRENHHFHLYFNEEYEVLSEEISYGHDIEGTWLLYEAAEALRDNKLKEQIRKVALNMADATLEEGMDPDGGLIYEASPEGVTNPVKSWWSQAESVVGFYNAFQLSGREKYRKAAFKSWEFIRENLTDKQYGEWFRRVSREGERYPDDMKVSAWKGPYHNSRMCFEMIERLGRR